MTSHRSGEVNIVDHLLTRPQIKVWVGFGEGYPIWSELTESLLCYTKFNDGYGRNVSQHTVHHTLLCMRLRSCRSVRVPMMTPVHHQSHLQKGTQAPELDLGPVEEGRLVRWVTFSFTSHGRPFIWEVMAPGCSVEWRQAGLFKVLPWPPNAPNPNPFEHLWDVVDQ